MENHTNCGQSNFFINAVISRFEKKKKFIAKGTDLWLNIVHLMKKINHQLLFMKVGMAITNFMRVTRGLAACIMVNQFSVLTMFHQQLRVGM